MIKHALLALVFLASPVLAEDPQPKYVDTWMFDTQPITATAPAPGKTSFTAKDRIYARVFFDAPIKDVIERPSTISLEAQAKKVAGEPNSGSYAGSAVVWVLPTDADLEKKWLDIEILPDPKTARTVYETERTFHRMFIDALAHPGPRPVELWISEHMRGGNRRVVTVTIDFAGFDAKKLEAEQKAVLVAGKLTIASQTPLPKAGRLHNAALAKTTAALVKRRDAVSAARVIITGDEWYVERNELTGVILRRNVEGAVMVKNDDGTCEVSLDLLSQPYISGRFQSPGRWLDVMRASEPIECAKAFK